jgi:hypothetical protein
VILLIVSSVDYAIAIATISKMTKGGPQILSRTDMDLLEQMISNKLQRRNVFLPVRHKRS